MIGPCFKCEKRSPPCHGDCQEYETWREQLKKTKDAEQAVKKREGDIGAVKMHGMKCVGKQIYQR